MVSYTYDTWGKLISTTGSLSSTVGVKNPYRYRWYRFDTESGLYYLQSRYYNPDWGRFVNADTITGNTGELLTANMFAYCRNNAVNHADPNGDWVLDAIFALQDAAGAISHPSVSSVGWVLLDVICLADPTDIGATAAHALKAARESKGVLHVVEGAKNLVRDFKVNRTSGSYTIHFKSGMKYHGEGSLARARQSYRKIIKNNPHEELSHIHWTPAKNQHSGFKQEHMRLSNDLGPGKGVSRNYNKNNSPGRRYY